MKRYARILYVIDSKLNSMQVIAQVMKHAKACQASVTLLDVIESLPPHTRMLVTSMYPNDLINNIRERRLAELEAFISMIVSDSAESTARVLFGNRAKEIARESAEGDYDLVIKISGKPRTDKYLTRNCSCPVWLLKQDDHEANEKIFASLATRLSAKDNKQPMDIRPSTRAGYYTV